MRPIAIFIFLTISVCFGQSILDEKITVSFNDKHLQACIIEIGKSSSINFSYNSKLLHETGKKITQSFTDTPVSEVLDYLLINTKLVYKEIGGQISIFEDVENQSFVTISGYVRNKSSQEEIVGARLYFKDLGLGCVTNAYGYYALEVPESESELIVSSVGMSTKRLRLKIESDLVYNINMYEDTVALSVVEVFHEGVDYNAINYEDISGVNTTLLTIKGLKKIPPSIGEYDLAKYAQQIPGVQPSISGTANYQVRGSSANNNLLLIDEIPIYHPSHLLGIYSIINSDAVKSAYLYKDYIPPSYGFRSSSVLQIRTNEGNLNKFHVNGGLSFISLRANVEGPIKKDVSSFYLSARGSTIPNAIGNYLYQNQIGSPSFLDVNLKLNYKLNSNNRIYLTGYIGRDIVSAPSGFYSWGNRAASFRWNHTFGPKTFSNLSLIVSDFRYHLTLNNPLAFQEQNVFWPQIKYDFTTFIDNQTTISYGVNVSMMQTFSNKNKDNLDYFLNRKTFDNGAYFSLNKRLRRNLEIEAGFRIPFSFHLGNQDTTNFIDSDYNITTVVYHKNKLYDLKTFIDPRILLTYYPNMTSKIEMSLNVATQNVHMVNYVNSIVPVQVWINSSSFLPPEHSYQISGGYTKQFKKFTVSSTVFGRYVQNVIDFSTPNFSANNDIESNLLTGHILSTGIESMLKYEPSEIYTCSVGYSFLFARQKTPGVNFNQYYPTLNNRPHYFNFSQYLKITKKWELASNLILHSPTAITLPAGQFVLNNIAYPLYSEYRNNEKLPFYARLDFSATRRLGIKKNRDNFWITLNFQNILGRYNPSIIYLVPNSIEPTVLDVRSDDFTPFLITASLNFKF